MCIQEKLAAIQQSLKAPKGQWNDYSSFNYRSCSDLVEAVKGHLDGAILTLSDDMVAVGDRVYVKATATLAMGSESISTTAFAREAVTKKGMDDSQITGTASSYARKYALNGLFAIDDTKDADTNDYSKAANDALRKSHNAIIKSVTDNDQGACREACEELSKPEKKAIWAGFDLHMKSAITELLNGEAA
jgi:hypothetical protein